jgi:8-oxo-dGTP diphosphatase
MALPTRAVKAIITDGAGRLLLLRRSARENEKGGNYDLPGGLVEDGEDERTALLREVEEELSLVVRVKDLAGAWHFLRPKDGQMVRVQNYICEIERGTIRLSDEHTHSVWVRREDVRSYPTKDVSFYAALE